MAAEAGIFVTGKAATWSVDREGELFEPGAFDAGIAEYLKNPVVAFMHGKTVVEAVGGPSKYTQLGVTTDLRRERDGLRWRAFLPRPASGFLLDIYNQVKAGIMRGLSVGGIFHKRGAKIARVDLQEISIAPKGQNPEALIETVELAATAPVLSSCGEACTLRVGAEGKIAAGTEDLAAALDLVEFAAGLRDLRGALAARDRAELERTRADLRRQVEAVRVWS